MHSNFGAEVELVEVLRSQAVSMPNLVADTLADKGRTSRKSNIGAGLDRRSLRQFAYVAGWNYRRKVVRLQTIATSWTRLIAMAVR